MKLDDLFREWQADLRLLDWNLQYAVRSGLEMDGDHGHVNVYPKKQCAFIRLLDPADAEPEESEPYDPEVAVVHEQLHCKLWPFLGAEGEFENDVQEQAVHALSVLIVAMKRRVRELEAREVRRNKRFKVAA